MKAARGKWVTVLSVAMLLGVTTSAVAKSKTSKKAGEEPAAKEVDSNQEAEAAPAKQTAEAEKPVRKVDPLEAALAQALANSEPTQKPKPPKKKLSAAERKAKKDGGLESLNKLARRASKADVVDWSHSVQIPVHEQTVKIDVQTLSADTVNGVIRANARKIQYCHERLAARGLAPNGEVSVSFVIHPKGHATQIKVVAGGANATELEQCMVRHIKTWKFPATDAPTPVEYPFVFDIAGSTTSATSK